MPSRRLSPGEQLLMGNLSVMQEVKDLVWKNETLKLNGYRFVNCEFIGCSLCVDAIVISFPSMNMTVLPFEMSNCRITGCTFSTIRSV